MTTKAKQKSISMQQRSVFATIGMYVLAAFLSLFIILPILWMVSTAFKTEMEIYTDSFNWIPKTITFESFEKFWGIYNFGSLMLNSLIAVVFSTVICVCCACLAGYGTSRFKFRGKGAFMGFLMLTQMFPSVMLVVPFYAVLNTYGLINTRMSLIVVYAATSVAFCTWMMTSFFKTLPIDLDEAAMIDGCTRFKTFYKIILPLTLPGIASVSIFSFIQGWNDYMFANILISKDALKTLTVGIVELNSQYQVHWNDMMAASIVASLPLLLVFLCFQQYFISGLTSGAVKS